MSLAGLASRAQAAAEALMVDACTITRPGTTPGAGATTVYSGKCRIRATTSLPAAMPTESQEATVSMVVQRVDIPVSATGVKPNDKVHIDSSLDPSLVGTEAFIAGPMGQTASSAQRLYTRESLR